MGEQQNRNAGGYDNTNRGALFKNKKKVEGDNRPDCTGRIDVNGVEFYISGWWKYSDRMGEKFLSLSVQPADQRGGKAPPRQPSQKPAPPAAARDGDIPF